MRTMLMILAITLIGLAASTKAEMHVIVPAPILTAKDVKGAQRELTIKMPVVETVIDQQTKQVLSTTAKPTEYHLTVPDSYDYKAAGATYAATWDGKAPCITLLVGDPKAIHMAYMGWPMIDCVTWQAQQPATK